MRGERDFRNYARAIGPNNCLILQYNIKKNWYNISDTGHFQTD